MRAKAENILRAYRDLAGSVLYSNKSTLKRGSILFYGINPGYDLEAKHRVCWKIGDSLAQFATGFPDLDSESFTNPVPLTERLHKDRNLIDDQRWPRVLHSGEFCYTWDIGRADYQVNARNLLKLIPAHLDVIVGNWFVLQTRTAAGIKGDLKNGGSIALGFLTTAGRFTN